MPISTVFVLGVLVGQWLMILALVQFLRQKDI